MLHTARKSNWYKEHREVNAEVAGAKEEWKDIRRVTGRDWQTM